MLRYIYADDLHRVPELARTMFRDRAQQFHHRLKWEVTVAEDGSERDEYDALNPMYVIWQQADGTHGGSLRFLPTTGPCMVNDHFLHLTDGVKIQSPLVWECTRFCLAPGADARVSAALMLGGMEVGHEASLTHAVGVFDARMVRVYRRLSWGPIILGTCGTGRDAISVGLWSFQEDGVRETLLKMAEIPSEVSQDWLTRSLDCAGLVDSLPT